MEYQRERLELMEKSITFSNQINSEMYKNLYQDKKSMDMTLNEFKNLTSICWNEK